MMRIMKHVFLALVLLVALPVFASHRYEWHAVPADPCLANGAMIHATGLTDVPYIAILKIPVGCHSTPTSTACFSVYIPPTDFSAEAYSSPGEALESYYHAKLVAKRNAWLFSFDQKGVTVLVTRKK